MFLKRLFSTFSSTSREQQLNILQTGKTSDMIIANHQPNHGMADFPLAEYIDVLTVQCSSGAR